MSLNSVPASERIHIGFFGLRNAGKSSVVNAVTGQNLAIVSDIKGTTTDPVSKSMELLPLGPVVITDTPGTDDEGELGELRIKRALDEINRTDIAVLVIDSEKGMCETDKKLFDIFKEKGIPCIKAYNKCDLIDHIPEQDAGSIYVSAKENINIYELKNMIASVARENENSKKFLGDLIEPDDIIILVTPIDESAPKGRLILPQVQTIRDILDNGAVAVTVQVPELEGILSTLSRKPKMVITDSQVFGKVEKIVPDDILLTSFSILFARYKGELATLAEGAMKLDSLKDGDTVLISEGCTHHRQCNDIGSVKIPGWVEKYTEKKLNFRFTSGGEFPDSLSGISLVIHCGGCMLSEREMRYRIMHSLDGNVPITNYGIAIAKMHGILKRALSPFPELYDIM